MAPVPTQRSFAAGTAFPPTTPGRLRLYSMRFCPYAQRARLVLAHKNIEYETVNVDLKNKPAWFLERNPLGQVPFLELDDKSIAESTAVCDYLDEVYPGARLTPTDPYRKARDRVLAEYLGKMASCLYQIRFVKDNEKAKEDLLKHYKYFEDVFTERGSTFLGGDQPAMIDFLIWPMIERIPGQIVPLVPKAELTQANFPRLAAYNDAMRDVPAVKVTMFDDETHAEYVRLSKSEGRPNYDLNLKE